MDIRLILAWAALLLCGSIFLFGGACLLLVSWKFLQIFTTLGADVAREILLSLRPAPAPPPTADPEATKHKTLDERVQELMATRYTPSEGGHDSMNDEEAWMEEQANALRDQGWTEPEVQEQVKAVKQAMAEEAGRPTKFSPQVTSEPVEG